MFSTSKAIRFIATSLRKALRLGKVPSQRDMEKLVRDNPERLSSDTPSTKPLQFGTRQRFSTDLWNDNSERVVEDVDFLYDESLEQAERLVRMFGRTAQYTESYRNRMRILEEQVSDALMTINNNGGIVSSRTIGFTSLADIDIANTTAQVDCNAGEALLAEGGGYGRIPINPSSISWTAVDSEGNSVEDASLTPVNTASLVDSDLQVGFYPYLNLGASEVGGIRIRLRLPLEHQYCNTITLEPGPMYGQTVRIRTSGDGINYTVLSGAPSNIFLDRPRRIHFDRSYVPYIELTVTTNIFSQASVGNIFNVGLAEIGVYDERFTDTSTLITHPVSPRDDHVVLGKVTLDAKDVTPPGTRVDYFISQAPANSGISGLFWNPISNTSRPTDSPMVVDFGGVLKSRREDNNFSVLLTPTINTVLRGVSYYKLHQIQNSGIANTGIIPGSGKLYRGHQCWRSSSSSDAKIELQGQCVLDTTDYASILYLQATDEAYTPMVDDGDLRIQTRYPILNAGLTTVVSTGLTSSVPTKVSKVRHLPSTGLSQQAYTSIHTPNNDNNYFNTLPVFLGQPQVNIVFQFSTAIDGPISRGDRAKAVNTSTLVTTLGTVEGVSPDRKVLNIAMDASITAGVYTVSIIDRDITAYVTSAEGNIIDLDNSLFISGTDTVLVTYNHHLPGNAEVTSLGLVAQGPLSPAQVLPGEYDFDEPSRVITMRTDSYYPPVKVVANFVYKIRVDGLTVYTTNLRVDSPTNVRLSSGVTGIADDEHVSIIGPPSFGYRTLQGSDPIDLVFPRGEYIVQVRSVPAWDGTTTNTSSAIYKTINLTTEDGYYLFTPNFIFSRQIAIAAPLRQVSISNLYGNTRITDRNVFAFDNGLVVTNFNPYTENAILRLLPGAASPVQGEWYQLEYNYVGDNGTVSGIRVKAVINREGPIGSDITASIRRITLKYF